MDKKENDNLLFITCSQEERLKLRAKGGVCETNNTDQ